MPSSARRWEPLRTKGADAGPLLDERPIRHPSVAAALIGVPQLYANYGDN